MAVTRREERNAVREAAEQLDRLTTDYEDLSKNCQDLADQVAKLRQENAYLKGQGGV